MWLRLRKASIGVDAQRKAGRIRRDDGTRDSVPLERDGRNAEGLIVVVAFLVFLSIAGFRDAPRNAALPREGALDFDHSAERARDKRVRVAAHPERGHQVLEHGARPGDQDRAPVCQRVGAAQFEPALLGSLAFGYCDEGGDAGFARKHVIASLVQVLGLHLVSNREQQARAVQQEGEIHFGCEAHRFRGQRCPEKR